jgi:multisubunit Na+/H+ antiporter MnhE subunit
MGRVITWSFPLAFVWIILANQPTIAGFLIGYIFAIAILLVIGIQNEEQSNRPFSFARIPQQIVAFIYYALTLTLDIILSGFDVAGRLLARDISKSTEPDIYVISTNAEDDDWIIAALSAHAITITPGSLVVDYIEGDESEMIVHVLDKRKWTKEILQEEQDERLKRIKRWLGYDWN